MRIAIPGTPVSVNLKRRPAWRAEFEWGAKDQGQLDDTYAGDGLVAHRRNLGALQSERFRAAYRRGINTPHLIGGGGDIHIEWRIHTCLWAAEHGMSLAGDFVECGVNSGITSLAVCEYVRFAQSSKRFFLFDTFQGIPEDQAAAQERENVVSKNSRIYRECYDQVKETFSGYPNVHLVRGTVPATLGTVDVDKVAYLSIDMNVAFPEIKALEHFWERLVPGAIVVLDDYGFAGHQVQYDAVNAFAAKRGVPVYTSPTGQGLIIRPPV
jgi:hypothetical protein